ncbi:aspartate/glutamate racemase family protein [Paracoccus cavernae]|uniref:Aspartate/glutamate racemase family protein n=1 Tax=Paracoccus cavernae TaxID=1571207 RepID=A0ABT8D9U4_9RHOB|nr:aspartate/glutamate racemase family protein [Paracoccus cavernae]
MPPWSRTLEYRRARAFDHAAGYGGGGIRRCGDRARGRGRPRVGAIIVSAFSDPGLAELRKAVDVPVFGIGEEVFHEAARDGRPFGIVTVTPDPALIESFREKAASLGYEAQYRGTRVTEGDPKVLVEQAEALDAALAAAVTESVAKDGASAVIMGGGPLSASAVRLQPQFEAPLLVAVHAAARAAAKAITQAQ